MYKFHNIWAFLFLLCSSFNLSGQNFVDTIPRFELVSIEGGRFEETKPTLAQRINGSKELIIVYPASRSTIDEIVATSLYNYFKELGINVSYYYAKYEKEQVSTNPPFQRASCSLTDIDFVKNSNTLVLIPDYVWGGYNHILKIWLNIIDMGGGNFWSITLDDLRIDIGKRKINKTFIKELQKQVTDSYVYDSTFSVTPLHVTFSWKERDFKNYCDQNPDNLIDGIYNIEDEKIGIHIDEEGDCRLVYLSGSKFEEWTEGESKGIFEATSTPNLYKGDFCDSFYRVYPATIIFKNGLVSISLDEGEFKSYLKTYPKAVSSKKEIVKNWSGTGFALNNGYLVTNHHVIDNATSILVRGINGDNNTKMTASVVGIDKNFSR
ncbi:MAG: serine protease [Bacteroides sp.]|nr:serine protease [Bacteroides sp.]MCM1380264.1 serine protease [Bacteroides sp.]MCM1446569.1 serine protease [Prevotella sp.]